MHIKFINCYIHLTINESDSFFILYVGTAVITINIMIPNPPETNPA